VQTRRKPSASIKKKLEGVKKQKKSVLKRDKEKTLFIFKEKNIANKITTSPIEKVCA
jgi:hypothetical protein